MRLRRSPAGTNDAGSRCAARRGDPGSGHVFERQQRLDEALVVTPAADGTLVELLPYLPKACRQHRPVRGGEIQATLVPLQAEKIDDLATPTRLIRDQFLVWHIQQ